MRTFLLILAILVLGITHPLEAQDYIRRSAPTDEAADFTNQVLTKEITDMETSGSSILRFLEGGTHNFNIRHDENITPETAVYRAHEDFVDVWVVRRGSGILVTGGEMVDGEHRGGVERVIGVGDVIFIPTGTLHGIKDTRSITWLNIRYNYEEE